MRAKTNDGVAFTLCGDVVVMLWTRDARLHRSRWLYDQIDRAIPLVPDGLLGLMILLPSVGYPDGDTRRENTVRLRRLKPYARRLVTVPLGDGLWKTITRGLARAMTVAAGWVALHWIESSIPQGVDVLLGARGEATPPRDDILAAVEEQFAALGVDAARWMLPSKRDRREAPAVLRARPERDTITTSDLFATPGSSPLASSGAGGIRVADALPIPNVELPRHLRLLRPLGQGGMGVLWVAEHAGLQCEVVVKLLYPWASRSQSLSRVAREAKAAAVARSPHVIQILDHGVCPRGNPYLIMELLQGTDLRSHLAGAGGLDIHETEEVIAHVADALDSVHRAGFVHVDVKPSNVFVCAGRKAFCKLLDFGLARPINSPGGDAPWQRAGSLRHMSPEHLRGEPLDPASDVWSLGVVAFQCLTGVVPFDGETDGAVRLAIESLPLPRPSELRRDLGPAVDDWFLRSCARAPQTRFATAVEAADALAKALGPDGGTHKRPSSGFPAPVGATRDATRTRTG